MLEDYASLCEEYSNHQITHQQQQVIDFSPFEEDPSEINQHVCYKPCNKLLLLYLIPFDIATSDSEIVTGLILNRFERDLKTISLLLVHYR